MADYKPSDRPAIIPRIITDDYAALAVFIRTVFGAEGETQHGMPTELRFGEALIMISDGGGVWPPTGAFLYVYVPDVDAVHARAVAAGATITEPPTLQFYGDRRATFKDRWGNVWQAATPQS